MEGLEMYEAKKQMRGQERCEAKKQMGGQEKCEAKKYGEIMGQETESWVSKERGVQLSSQAEHSQ